MNTRRGSFRTHSPGSPRAVAFLIADLQATPEEGQTLWALVLAGEKAAPAIAGLYHKEKPMSRELASVSSNYEKLPWRAEPEVLTTDQLLIESYTIEIVGYDEKGKHVMRRDAHPGCAMRVEDGILLGGSRGEWGGELVFKDKAGRVTTLVDDNTTGIHRMPFGILATTGVAHLGLNHGYLYLVDFKEGSPPKTKLWKVLPGAPMISRRLKSGDLFVACVGGNVLISPSGEMTMASPDLGERKSKK